MDSEDSVRVVLAKLGGSKLLEQIWAKYIASEHTFDVMTYRDVGDEMKFKRCIWEKSKIIKAICPSSLYVIMDITRPHHPLFSIHPMTKSTTHAKIKRMTPEEFGAHMDTLHLCDESIKPLAMFLSVHYMNLNKKTNAVEKSGHANILFVENDRLVRFDPNGQSKLTAPIDEALTAAMHASHTLSYKSMVSPPVPSHLINHISLQRLSKRFSIPGQRGACLMWVMLVAIAKSEHPKTAFQDIVVILSSMDAKSLYEFITAVTAYFVNTCSAHVKNKH